MTPSLTVVLLTTGGIAALERALAALAPQIAAGTALLVITNDAAVTAEPTWRTDVLPGASVPHMRTHALGAAAGDTIALLTDRYVVAPDWLTAVIDASRRNHALVGWGPIDHGGEPSTPAWARHFAEYGAYMSPVGAAQPRALPGANVWFSRQVVPGLLAASPSGTEMDWTRYVRAAGIGVAAAPAAVVHHRHDAGTRAYLVERYHYGRSLARARLAGATTLGRGSHAVRSLLLPIVLLGRWCGDVWRRPAWRGRLLRALPRLAVFAATAAAGELAGSVATRSARGD
jgi:hypothetical protein